MEKSHRQGKHVPAFEGLRVDECKLMVEFFRNFSMVIRVVVLDNYVEDVSNYPMKTGQD